ncbi:hypothetical protein AXG93_285s1400 [Marchantia polymorpha subsp. ruderalis]|uniref:Uncharacterized protein n=1 Tax=Marchantia polymorpha subsp. ruderalis TaxID=1480154 RepID=A0A176VT16_MARPO|nr:hypothetical protein AXG93_285s1400 [Marchantia polymorpha subsp. ruderalis]
MKVKAQGLILEDDSSVVASQGYLTSAEWAEVEADTVVREKDGPSKKYIRSSKMRPLAVKKRRATRKEKGKVIMTEEGTPKRNPVPSAEAIVIDSLEKPAEVLTMSSDTEEYPVALEKIAERVAEGVAGEATGQHPQAREVRCAHQCRILVELVRNKTRVKVATAHAVVEKKKQLRCTGSKYEVETQKWLQLRNLDRRAIAMIACSVSGQRQLAIKLDAFFISSCEAMTNLELELTAVLCRLGLDRKSDSAAIADSAVGVHVRSIGVTSQCVS